MIGKARDERREKRDEWRDLSRRPVVHVSRLSSLVSRLSTLAPPAHASPTPAYSPLPPRFPPLRPPRPQPIRRDVIRSERAAEQCVDPLRCVATEHLGQLECVTIAFASERVRPAHRRGHRQEFGTDVDQPEEYSSWQPESRSEAYHCVEQRGGGL